jgi:hypothetical protein
MTNEELETFVKEKNLTAPRITLDSIKDCIINEIFWQPSGTSLTICVLTLKNGTFVTGSSACVSSENFNEELGKKLAKDNAISKIWALEGYLLKQKLFEQN